MGVLSSSDIVVEILRKLGKWGESADLVASIKQERKVSNRQAYRDLKAAWKNEKVRKIRLPEGIVLYGLPNWPFPKSSAEKPRKETLTFQDAFLYRCFKQLEEVGKLSISKPTTAFLRLGNLIAMLRPPEREKVEPSYKAVHKGIVYLQEEGMARSIHPVETDNKIRALVRHLVGEVAKVLHES